jgi:hypothetical protein
MNKLNSLFMTNHNGDFPQHPLSYFLHYTIQLTYTRILPALCLQIIVPSSRYLFLPSIYRAACCNHSTRMLKLLHRIIQISKHVVTHAHTHTHHTHTQTHTTNNTHTHTHKHIAHHTHTHTHTPHTYNKTHHTQTHTPHTQHTRAPHTQTRTQTHKQHTHTRTHTLPNIHTFPRVSEGDLT